MAFGSSMMGRASGQPNRRVVLGVLAPDFKSESLRFRVKRHCRAMCRLPVRLSDWHSRAALVKDPIHLSLVVQLRL
jgi:hypothetical protein